MKIEMRSTDSIRPYPGNPRQNDSAVAAVAASIREFGFRQPIVVDGGGVIVVGHTRWKAAIELGLDKVPVHVAADLTPEKARAYRLADNKTNELAEWDIDLLVGELSAIELDGIDLGALGFDSKEINALLSRSGEDAGSDWGEATSDDKIIAKITIPPKPWLVQQDKIVSEIEGVASQYGATIEWPK